MDDLASKVGGLAHNGGTDQEIADVLGMPVAEIQARYSGEIARGRAERRAKLKQMIAARGLSLTSDTPAYGSISAASRLTGVPLDRVIELVLARKVRTTTCRAEIRVRIGDLDRFAEGRDAGSESEA